MAELLDADHQPISLSAVTQAFELARHRQVQPVRPPFGHGPSGRDFVDTNAAYAGPTSDTNHSAADRTSDANEQAGTRLKWSERLGWTPDSSAVRPVAEVNEPDSDVIDSELLTFDSDEEHPNQGRDAADPPMALDESSTNKREPRSSESYEGLSNTR